MKKELNAGLYKITHKQVDEDEFWARIDVEHEKFGINNVLERSLVVSDEVLNADAGEWPECWPQGDHRTLMVRHAREIKARVSNIRKRMDEGQWASALSNAYQLGYVVCNLDLADAGPVAEYGHKRLVDVQTMHKARRSRTSDDELRNEVKRAIADNPNWTLTQARQHVANQHDDVSTRKLESIATKAKLEKMKK